MGYKIKDKREECKMSQQELAEKSGVSRQTISNIENGATDNVLTGTLFRIAKALGTTINELFFDENV